MRIKISKPGTIELQVIFELLICIFYTWYFLPISQALLWQYKTIMFGLFAAGTVALAFLNDIRLTKILIPILAYMLLLTVLSLCKVDDASKHIRVSFTFWGTALLYFGVLDDKGRIRIGKYLLVLFFVTAVTSALGVMIDNNAARTIARAAADEELQNGYKLKNISGIYLFQGLVLFVPLLVCIPKKPWTKTICWMVLIAILMVLISASFTISLIVFVFSLLLSLMFKESKKTKMGQVGQFIFLCLVVVLLLNGSSILQYLGNNIKNHKVATRMLELRQLIYFGESQGDAALRVNSYTISLETFLRNPFGVGAHYSYDVGSNGLGYHSKILDDLARFGIFALAFYAVFFVSYYKHLKAAWTRAGYPRIAIFVVVTWILFLLLNIGFRSADESIVMLFLMPVIPLLVNSRNENEKKEG